VSDLLRPLQSLEAGHWFKLIGGASFQHGPAVRSLTLAYAIAGADCIDIAADPAIIAMAHEALAVADRLRPEAQRRGIHTVGSPLLMVSLNDGEDPHFRKAEFDPHLCPADCPRPCATICPAAAIELKPNGSVIADRCYGCGRCLPICPIGQIAARSYVSTPAVVAELVLQTAIDAVEIHTQVGREAEFRRLWAAIRPGLHRLKLVAVSCPDGENLIDYLWALYKIMGPLPCALIWQTDGRPMSGDIGDGATRACVRLGQKVAAAGLPGYVQLAGGTNWHTVEKLREDFRSPIGAQTVSVMDRPIGPLISGIAYGSYARRQFTPLLEQLEAWSSTAMGLTIGPATAVPLEAVPELLWSAVDQARHLVGQLKYFDG
jgi:Fe-S-cluster-containing hydrogenase component 2